MFKSFFTVGLDTNLSGLITLGIPSYDGFYPSDAIDLYYPTKVTGIDSLLFNNKAEILNRVITNIGYTQNVDVPKRVILNIFYG